jgi:hypothetical protein
LRLLEAVIEQSGESVEPLSCVRVGRRRFCIRRRTWSVEQLPRVFRDSVTVASQLKCVVLAGGRRRWVMQPTGTRQVPAAGRIKMSEGRRSGPLLVPPSLGRLALAQPNQLAVDPVKHFLPEITDSRQEAIRQIAVRFHHF